MANDWLPRSQAGRLEMAKRWVEVITPQKATQWNIPQAELSNMTNGISMVENAQEQLIATGSPGDRVRVKEAFVFLVYNMRRMKRQRFTIPPLIDSDYADLGLRPPDTVKTTINAPTIQAKGDLAFPGVHMVEVMNMGPVGLIPGDVRAKWGFRIHFGIYIDTDDIEKIKTDTGKFRIYRVPATADDLPHSVFTRRRRHQFDFMGESGNRVFISICYENSKGERGPFGPMMHAVIP